MKKIKTVSDSVYPGPCSAFLSGAMNKKYDIYQLMHFTDDQLEFKHDYIQYAFPIKTPSGFNPIAPILSKKEIKWINGENGLKARINLKNMFIRMLQFYGFTLIETPEIIKCEYSSAFSERAKNWLTPNNHNFLRITRILISLRLLGLPEYAMAFYRILDELYSMIPDIISKKTYKYWTDAIVQKKRVKSHSNRKVIVIGRKGTRTNTSECYLKKYEDE